MLGGSRLTIASCLLLACSTEPPAPQVEPEPDACEVRVDRQLACGPDDDRDTAELTRRRALLDCRAQQEFRPTRAQAELACAQRADCGEFRRCMHDIGAREEAAAIEPTVAAALASGKGVFEALQECWKAPAIGDAELTQQCDALIGREVDRLTKQIEALRDAGKTGNEGRNADPDVWSMEIDGCQTLPQLAGRRSNDAFVRAVALCDEAAAAPDVAAAIAEAEKALVGDYWRRIPLLPFGCARAFTRLAELETPWARQRLRQLVDVCHVRAAKKTLATALRTDTRCPLDYEQIVAAVTMFEIDDRELAALLAKARKRCPKP